MEIPCAHPLLLMLLLSSLCVPSLSLTFNYSSLGTSAQPQGSLIATGNASIQNGYVQLTASSQLIAGRLYNSGELFLWDEGEAASFNCSFQFCVKPESGTGTGGGLTFLLSPNSSDPPVNSRGPWLGLFNTSNNGSASNQIVAVEFDTYYNADFLDPNGNHIGVDVNNIVSNFSVSDLGFNLSNSASVYAWVDYSSSKSVLEVYATNLSSTKPSSPLLSYSINLTLYLPQHVYVGFSASAGYDSANRSVVSWSFESTTIGVAAASSGAKKGSRAGLFIGLGAGLFLILTLLALLGLFIARRKRRRFDPSQADIPSGLDLSGLPSPSYGPRKFTYRELSSATNHFSQARLLGGGGFGPVYKGVLSEDGSEVAVKCIAQKSAQGEKEFFAEVTIIGRIRHRNLVQLKGWCREKAKLLLVYEFLPNGSLDHHLFDKAAASTLDWSTRNDGKIGKPPKS